MNDDLYRVVERPAWNEDGIVHHYPIGTEVYVVVDNGEFALCRNAHEVTNEMGVQPKDRLEQFVEFRHLEPITLNPKEVEKDEDSNERD